MIQAACRMCTWPAGSPSLDASPSIVVTLLPATSDTGVEQERVAFPSTCTVHAPQSPAPQPYFVPVSSRVSRKTQSSGVSDATETFLSLPFTRSVISDMLVQLWDSNPHNMVSGKSCEGLGGWRAETRNRSLALSVSVARGRSIGSALLRPSFSQSSVC